MHFFTHEKNRYAKLSTEAHARLGLEQPRYAAGQSRTMAACRSCQRSWNNFLLGIFHFVLKLFQKVEYYSKPEHSGWNIGIPAASTWVFQYRRIFQGYSKFTVLYTHILQGSKNHTSSRYVKFAGFHLKRLYNIHASLYDIFEP